MVARRPGSLRLRPARIRELEQENRELRRVNAILNHPWGPPGRSRRTTAILLEPQGPAPQVPRSPLSRSTRKRHQDPEVNDAGRRRFDTLVM